MGNGSNEGVGRILLMKGIQDYNKLAPLGVSEEDYEFQKGIVEKGKKIVGVLESCESTRARKVAVGVAICCSPSNLYVSSMEDGSSSSHVFRPRGALFSCGFRTCPACAERLQRRNRQRLKNILRAVVSTRGGLFFSLLTLTVPNQLFQRLSIKRAFSLVSSSYRRLHRSSAFQSAILGGAKSIEVVRARISDFAIHIHLIVATNLVPTSRLMGRFREAWSKALLVEVSRSDLKGVERINAHLDCKRITPSFTSLLKTGCYITKSIPVADLLPGEILAIAELKRFPRSFEVFGIFRDLHEKRRSGSQERDSHPSLVKENLKGKSLCRHRRPTTQTWVQERTGDSSVSKTQNRNESCPCRHSLENRMLNLFRRKTRRRFLFIRKLRMQQLRDEYPGVHFFTLAGDRF